jgi:hypothetical protein
VSSTSSPAYEEITVEVTSEPAPTSTPVISPIGVVEGLTYSNSYFGFTADFPEGWVIADETKLASISGQYIDSNTEDDRKDKIAEMIDSGTMFMDLFAQSAEGYNNVNLIIFKSDSSFVSMTSEEAVASQNLDAAKKALERVGYTNITSEVSSIVFAGKEHATIVSTAEYSSAPVYSMQIYILQAPYSTILSFFSITQNSIETVAGWFSAME